MKWKDKLSSKKSSVYILPFLLLSFLVNASEKLRIIDADTKKGLRSSIEKVTFDNKTTKVSVTGKNGYIQKDFDCDLLEKLIITADDSSYFQESIACPLSSKYIALTSATYTFNLVSNAKLSIRNGDLGTAAFAFNEAAWRTAKFEPNSIKSQQLELKTYETVGKFLEISQSTVFDVQQNKTVMTPELVKALQDYQNDNGLKEDGKLNFETMKKMSELPLNKVLFYIQFEN